jgi:hypothetical protein
MNYTNIKRYLICFAIGFFVISISANVFAGSSIIIQWGKGSESDNSKEVKKNKEGGPPSHAPAHGYRAKHQYRYYPSNSVYYDTDRGLYFYIKGDNWEVGASLPSPLKVGLGDYINLELETDKPYVHHKEHIKKYPPGKSKKKTNKKMAKKSKK